ncbi:MAG: sigma-70 family RNA polymerase sigma factor [Bacteroidetes bacterium]|nr:MAG: sigma-70 family RNA polymerase sigma factor [Bacteroidota bacterium]
MSLKELDDQALVSAYINGNEQAFECLLKRHKNRIYNLIFLKVRDSEIAEDIFQDTFIKIIRTLKLGQYNEEGKFIAWAMRIAHNLVIDHFRKSGKMRMINERSFRNEEFNILNILPSDAPGKLEQMSREELTLQIVELVQHLPEAQKEIIQMRIFEELSFKEIAEKKDISINTALGRMRYALINLRKKIESYQLVTDVA